MAETPNAPEAKEEIVPVHDNVFKFVLPNGDKPPLKENPQIMLEIDGVVTELPLERVFMEEPLLRTQEADITGYSALEYMDAEEEKGKSGETILKGTMTIDGKVKAIGLYDIETELHFKIGSFKQHWFAWFSKKMNEEDRKAFGKLIYGAKKLNIAKAQIEHERAEALKAEEVLLQKIEDEKLETKDVKDYAEWASLHKKKGYTEFKKGKLRFLYHPDVTEYIIKINDEKGIDFELLSFELVDENEKKELIYEFIDGEEHFTLAYPQRGKEKVITIEKLEEKPAAEPEEEAPAPIAETPAPEPKAKPEPAAEPEPKPEPESKPEPPAPIGDSAGAQGEPVAEETPRPEPEGTKKPEAKPAEEPAGAKK